MVNHARAERARLTVRVHRRDIEVHKGELELDAPRASLDLLGIGKALKGTEQLVQHIRNRPAARPLEFEDGIEIKSVVRGSIDDSCTDRS